MIEIPIFEPSLSFLEQKLVQEALETGWISSQGRFVEDFENSLASFHGVKYCVSTMNCTAALHLGMMAAGLELGDEVICPDLTFIAPANMAYLTTRNLKLLDVQPDTLNIDPDLIASHISDKTKAIICVNQFGHSCDFDEIRNLVKEKDVCVVEDNAEALGGKYKNKINGSHGDFATLSFFANKAITTGEGGALITNSETIANRARMIRDHGMNPDKKYDFLELGVNYRMTNMQAAVGVGQMRRLDEILLRRKHCAEKFDEAFLGVQGITVRKTSQWCHQGHWLYTVFLENNSLRDRLIAYLSSKGIEARPMIPPVSASKHFRHLSDTVKSPVSYDFSSRGVHFPSSTDLTNNQIDKICSSVIDFVKSA